jgi:transcription elongation factor GreB
VTRWRPPAPRSTAVITRAGQRRLSEELDRLWRTTRPEVVRALAAAAAEGDRSENAEYTYRKKQLGEIDRRVRYLGKRLPELRVIEDLPPDREVIRFGAWFVLSNAAGNRSRHRLVGPDESDHEPGWISVDSPLARAILGHRAGDEVAVELPGGRRLFRIEEVAYVADATVPTDP